MSARLSWCICAGQTGWTECHTWGILQDVTEPTITDVRHDASLDGVVVTVEPYRTTDYAGNPVEVHVIYGNGGLITAEGVRIKKNGTPYARRQTVNVTIPANVRAALGR